METPTVARDWDSDPADVDRVRAGPLLRAGPGRHALLSAGACPVDPEPWSSAPRMSYLDFLRQFSRLEICNLFLDSLSSEELHKWDLVLFNGRWTQGSTAGGCSNFPGEAEGGLRGTKSLWPVLPELGNASACSLAPGIPRGPHFSLGLEARAAGWTVAQGTPFCSFCVSSAFTLPPPALPLKDALPCTHRAPFLGFSQPLVDTCPPQPRTLCCFGSRRCAKPVRPSHEGGGGA